MSAEEIRDTYQTRLRNTLETADDLRIVQTQIWIEIAAQLAEFREEASSLKEMLKDMFEAMGA
jgi:hypothetical protein